MGRRRGSDVADAPAPTHVRRRATHRFLDLQCEPSRLSDGDSPGMIAKRTTAQGDQGMPRDLDAMWVAPDHEASTATVRRGMAMAGVGPRR